MENIPAEPLGGLLWWGPFVGLLIIFFLVAVLATAITLIVIKIVRR